MEGEARISFSPEKSRTSLLRPVALTSSPPIKLKLSLAELLLKSPKQNVGGCLIKKLEDVNRLYAKGLNGTRFRPSESS